MGGVAERTGGVVTRRRKLVSGGGRKRVAVYIDALNFYYGALRDRPGWKWVDLERWAGAVLPAGRRLSAVHYFASHVAGYGGGVVERQLAYLSALHALGFRDADAHRKANPTRRAVAALPPSPLARTGNLLIHYGRRRNETVVGRVPGTGRMIEVKVPKEKGTDVNLAARMLADAAHDRFDIAALVANDGDYVGLCRAVREEFADAEKFGSAKEVVLLPPVLCRGRGVVEELVESVGGEDNVIPVLPDPLAECQMPDVIPGTQIRRPDKWR